MQPRPYTINQTTISENALEHSIATTQHGFEHNLHPDQPYSDVGEGESTTSPHQPCGVQESTDGQGTTLSGRISARGLSPPQTSSPSSLNRIAQYENASLSPMRKKPEGPAFDVIKKSRKPGDKRSPISDLPNGKSIFEWK